jgi:DNA-binding IclR family transcriptional regulator
MAAMTLESNKAKIAKRVIEVLEFFGARNQPATVMDIARRYGRPQSSTSELLSSLVEMGLLYKDPASRSFTPTPRLATLGVAGQPEIIRDGRLFNYMDKLAQTARATVALFGMVGTHVQIFRWIPGPQTLSQEVGCGSSERLCGSAAGLLLLSTMAPDQSRGVLWRLNAEAASDAKFDHAEMVERVARFRQQGHAIGEAGFLPATEVCAVLLPHGAAARPLALGVLYPTPAVRDADALIETLKHGVGQVFSGAPDTLVTASPFVRAI